MMTGTIVGFAAVTAVAVITPGPDVLLALSNGSRFGLARAFAGMIGVLVSDVLLLLAVAVGFGAFLAKSELWFSVLKYAGAAYLAYLGIRMLLSRSGLAAATRASEEVVTRSEVAIGWRSFVVAMTNPKSYLFFSALLPQFVDPTAAQWPQFAVLALVLLITELVIMLGYALLGARAVHWMKGPGVVRVERICGGALLTSGVLLAFVRRAPSSN